MRESIVCSGLLGYPICCSEILDHVCCFLIFSAWVVVQSIANALIIPHLQVRLLFTAYLMEKVDITASTVLKHRATGFLIYIVDIVNICIL